MEPWRRPFLPTGMTVRAGQRQESIGRRMRGARGPMALQIRQMRKVMMSTWSRRTQSHAWRIMSQITHEWAYHTHNLKWVMTHIHVRYIKHGWYDSSCRVHWARQALFVSYTRERSLVKWHLITKTWQLCWLSLLWKNTTHQVWAICAQPMFVYDKSRRLCQSTSRPNTLSLEHFQGVVTTFSPQAHAVKWCQC